jgi:hemoglobin
MRGARGAFSEQSGVAGFAPRQLELHVTRRRTMSQPASEASLYERIGGEPAVRAAVDRFYERVLADRELKDFFKGVGMSRLKAHQLAFLSQALGGPRRYSGASMRDAHSRLAIEQRHFDAVAVHLTETLRELGVSEEIVAAIAAAVAPLSPQIVNTPAQAAAV